MEENEIDLDATPMTDQGIIWGEYCLLMVDLIVAELPLWPTARSDNWEQLTPILSTENGDARRD